MTLPLIFLISGLVYTRIVCEMCLSGPEPEPKPETELEVVEPEIDPDTDSF